MFFLLVFFCGRVKTVPPQCTLKKKNVKRQIKPLCFWLDENVFLFSPITFFFSWRGLSLPERDTLQFNPDHHLTANTNISKAFTRLCLSG